jgi:hypothetical protein
MKIFIHSTLIEDNNRMQAGLACNIVYRIFYSATVSQYIVTCQPYVGLRNRALLGNRPVNKTSRRHDDVTQQYWNTVSTQHAVVTSHGTGVGEYRVTCFLWVRRLRNKKQAALSACTIEGFIRGTEISKQSVCGSQLYEWGLDRRQPRELWRCKACDNQW